MCFSPANASPLNFKKTRFIYESVSFLDYSLFLEAEGIYLAKAIDGVYDSDPKLNPAAKKYDEVSIQEVIDQKLAVVDLTASIMCMENKMPMYVFGLNEENSIAKAMSGEFNGTKVTV